MNEGNIFREFLFSRLRFNSRNSRKYKPRENFYLYSMVDMFYFLLFLD